MACNCFHGTAVEDKNGNCGCVSTTDPAYWGPPINTDNNPPKLPPIIYPAGSVIGAVVNCNRHQAPSGYKYIYNNGQCVLMRRTATGYVTVAGVGVVGGGAVAGSAAAVASDFVANNKQLLAIAAVAGLAYYFGKKK